MSQTSVAGSTDAWPEPRSGDTDARTGAGRPAGGGRTSRLPSWWPVLVPILVVLVGAWLYRWVDEDAFINFRIIDNLVAGHGLVFNVGERVEVDSDPLWLFSLTFLHVVLPFIDLEWLSVGLGMVCTGLGFLTGGLAVQRLGVSRRESTVFPVGLLLVSVVAGVWEFATSGLEMSMVFLWLGWSFFLLVKVEGRRSRAGWTAVVLGLGTLIRPELALMSVVLVAALVVVVSAPGWSPEVSRFRRLWRPILASLALPVAFEIFRMAYFAMLVPNTALAKAAGSTWFSQGLTYLWNFVAPYTLWVPLAMAAVLLGGRAMAWWHRDDRLGVLLLATPVVAGLVDLLYVVAIGGDYMHARLLLPAFFALCLPVFCTGDQLRTAMAVPLAVLAVWAVICVGWLRFVPPPAKGLNPQTIFISNERNSWISATGNAHPVTAADYKHALSGQAGTLFARMARDEKPGQQEMLVITNPYAPLVPNSVVPAHSTLPFRLAVNVPAIGVIGYLAGPHVYIFDSFSLANPIGSHTTVVVHARPGHEKLIGPAWMVGRFGVPGEASTGGGPSATSVAAAARAISCDPLSAYLVAITSPLTASRAVANIGDSFRFTSMSYSADPVVAAGQLCTAPAAGAGS